MTVKATNLESKFDSELEVEYNSRLKIMKLAGEIQDYWYHAIRLKVGGKGENTRTSWYTPDFMVLTNDHTLEMIEVKGYKRNAEMVRIRAAADLYPYDFIVASKPKQSWIFERFTK